MKAKQQISRVIYKTISRSRLFHVTPGFAINGRFQKKTTKYRVFFLTICGMFSKLTTLRKAKWL
jgi:hypothetical protein